MKKTWVCRLLALFLVIGNWKGYVAVFKANEDEPWQIYPQKVSCLSDDDQEALNRGIVVRNDRDLQRLLEDFLS